MDADRMDLGRLANVRRNMEGWIERGEGPTLTQVRDTLAILKDAMCDCAGCDCGSHCLPGCASGDGEECGADA